MAGKDIFQRQDGRQIKFFIQKDLEVEIVKTLHTQITENGGRVETMVPIQGYILIEPRSPEGERLIDCWQSSDRPLRYLVPYTFVAACLDTRRLIPQVFRKNGKALQFHIHPSIPNEKVIEAIRKRISHSGGNPFATELEANIVIADESTPNFLSLNERFDHHHNTFVEGIPWVKQCVESGVYKNTPVVKRNLGGRAPGTKRTEFTLRDDNLLAGYIACRLPDPDMRGRTGNKLYHELCTRIDLYPWAARHPWQSWRERYKNNSARFNTLIATYLEYNPVPTSGKGLHGFIRVATSPLTSHSEQASAMQFDSPSKVPFQKLDDKSEPEWGSEWPTKEGNKSPPPWGKRKWKPDGVNTRESIKQKNPKYDHSGEHEQSSVFTCPCLPEFSNQESPQEITPRMNRPGLRNTRVNEVADAVLFGDTLRARWMSPAVSDDVIKTLGNNGEDVISEGDGVGHETQALLHAHRAMLTSSKQSFRMTSSLPEGDRTREPDSTDLTVDPRTTSANSNGDDVELALFNIACEYRFLSDEVIEEYEELGRDLDATRSYFKEIRALITVNKGRRNKFTG